MKTMDSQQKPGIMARIRNSKGFSLVEMALVLVIIGVIIAAVIKGQDLMVNARAKQLISAAQAWKIAAYAYVDRNGRFPGDFSKDGNIGSSTSELTVGSTAIDDISSYMSQAPANPVIIAGQTYWFYLGNVEAVAAGSTRNAIIICKSQDCTAVMSSEDAEIMKALDNAIDGTADAGTGQVRAITVAMSPGTAATVGTGYFALDSSNGSRANGIVNVPFGSVVSTTAAGTADTVWASTHYGVVWAFDKAF